jgi:hypothetical protein
MYFPKRDVVELLIRESLKDRKARSQRELAGMVKSKLMKIDSDYAITEKRARSIAMGMDSVRMSVFTRTGRKPEACPVCRSEIREVYSKDLRGRKILLKAECRKCEYSGQGNKWIPSRYEFWIG